MDAWITGGCLCGLVTYRLRGPFRKFYFCHCSRCRKSSGSAHGTNIFAGPHALEWLSGKERVQDFALADAKFFNKSFCSRCGSPVPHKARSGEFIIVPAGSLDQDPGALPDNVIFWESRAPWYEAGCAAPKSAAYPPNF